MATTKVNTEFIAVNAISGTIIADNAITATHIATNAISGTLVQNGGIVTTMIAANNITSTKIVTDAVLTRHIADDQVTAAKLANSINTDIATGPAALPKAGGTVTGNTTFNTLVGINKAINSSVGLSVGADATATNSYGLEVCNSTSNTRFLVDGVGSSLFYKSDNALGMKFDASNGNLGIGGAPGAQLDVNSGTTNTIAHFHSTDDNGFIELKDDNTTGYIGVQDDYVYIGGAPSRSAQNLVINDGDGKVGIGDTDPFSKLHVEDTGWSSGAPYGTVLSVTGNNVNDDNWGHLIVTDSSTANGNGGSIRFATGTADSSNLNPFAGIQGVAEGTSHGGLAFYTRPSGGSATERAHIDSGGNFTIGAEPAAPTGGVKGKIHIDGGTGSGGKFDALAIKHINTTTTGDGPALKFEGEYNGSDWALAKMSATNGGAGYGANFAIDLHPGAGTQGSNVLSAFNLKRTVSNQLHMHLHAGGATTYADEASTTTSVANTSCLISIQSQRRAGSNSIAYDAALFFCHYGIDSGTSVVELADPGGTFAASDTDGMVCVYKGNNSANVTIKNRLGYSTGLSVQFIRFLGN